MVDLVVGVDYPPMVEPLVSEDVSVLFAVVAVVKAFVPVDVCAVLNVGLEDPPVVTPFVPVKVRVVLIVELEFLREVLRNVVPVLRVGRFVELTITSRG